MGQKILSYSTAIAISLLLLLPAGFTVHAQQRPYVNPTPKRDQKKNVKEEPKEIVPLYNGTYIGVDLYGIGSKLLGGDLLSSEINVAVNLKNMFLPTVDVGFGTTDSWSDTGIHYKSSAPFFRIGVDYNTMAKKKEKNSFLYVGLRCGFSHMKYDISSLAIQDPDKPITRKPADVRMGKGKGAPEGFVAPVTPGRIIIEAEGVSYEIAKEALRLAAQKLPITTKFVVRRDYDIQNQNA